MEIETIASLMQIVRDVALTALAGGFVLWYRAAVRKDKEFMQSHINFLQSQLEQEEKLSAAPLTRDIEDVTAYANRISADLRLSKQQVEELKTQVDSSEDVDRGVLERGMGFGLIEGGGQLSLAMAAILTKIIRSISPEEQEFIQKVTAEKLVYLSELASQAGKTKHPKLQIITALLEGTHGKLIEDAMASAKE